MDSLLTYLYTNDSALLQIYVCVCVCVSLLTDGSTQGDLHSVWQYSREGSGYDCGVDSTWTFQELLHSKAASRNAVSIMWPDKVNDLYSCLQDQKKSGVLCPSRKHFHGGPTFVCLTYVCVIQGWK